MTNKLAIKNIVLRNLLSFGEEGIDIDLKPLNVLIGPNASGKSNLIECVRLLSNTPTDDLLKPIREGGGIGEWLRRNDKGEAPSARIEATIPYPEQSDMPLKYKLEFNEEGGRFTILDERIENERPFATYPRPYYFFVFDRGRPRLGLHRDSPDNPQVQEYRGLRREDIDPQKSVLSQFKDPEHLPALTYLGRHFSAFRIHSDLNVGRRSQVRGPQAADQDNLRLESNAANLALVLNRLCTHVPGFEDHFTKLLNEFSGSIERVTFAVDGGTFRFFIRERNVSYPISTYRMSDGTLRWIWLLTILLDPNPAPLICIEEPEIGLHPDIIPKLADLLVDASARTQIIVTTHSDVLVDALTDTPDAVIVCEKQEGSTTLQRLDPERLKSWLEEYTLGELWTSGEIGGNRW